MGVRNIRRRQKRVYIREEESFRGGEGEGSAVAGDLSQVDLSQVDLRCRVAHLFAFVFRPAGRRRVSSRDPERKWEKRDNESPSGVRRGTARSPIRHDPAGPFSRLRAQGAEIGAKWTTLKIFRKN